MQNKRIKNKPIKMSPNSTVEVVSASSSLIDNTNGYIGARTLDQYPVKMVKSWRIKAGTPAGELLNMNLRNIGETDSGKTISAHNGLTTKQIKRNKLQDILGLIEGFREIDDKSRII